MIARCCLLDGLADGFNFPGAFDMTCCRCNPASHRKESCWQSQTRLQGATCIVGSAKTISVLFDCHGQSQTQCRHHTALHNLSRRRLHETRDLALSSIPIS